MILRRFVPLLLTLCAVASVAAAQELPVTVSLDGDWDFAYQPSFAWADAEQKVPALPADDQFAAKMPVPGYWDDNLDRMRVASNSFKFWSSAKFTMNKLHGVDFPRKDWPPLTGELMYLEGAGFYRKSIDVPQNWQGNKVVLHIGNVRIGTQVWINGEYLGRRVGGQAFPLEWSLGDKIKSGAKNDIVIGVDNITKAGGCDTWNDQNYGAGIFRSVYLKVSGGGRIADLYAYPREANKKLLWNVELDGNSSGDSLEWAVEDPSTGATLGKGNTAVTGQTVSWTTETFGMRPWSDHEPNLYNLKATLTRGGKTIDKVEQSFGLRTIVRDGIGSKLNGRPVMLRGAHDCYGYAVTKSAPTDVNYYRNAIRNTKQIGFNWIRFHTWVPCEEYLQAADELGMMIQVEAGYGFNDAEGWASIIRYCRKHPSVVLYCYGNEQLLDEAKIDILRERGAQVHKLAPDALFNPMEALFGVEWWTGGTQPEAVLGPDRVDKPYPHNARRLETLKQFSDAFGSYSWGQLSYIPQTCDWKELDRRYEAYERPILSHEVCLLGTYLDLGLQWRYEGTPVGADPLEYVQTRQNLRDAGLLQKANTFYVNSCRVTVIMRKWILENARKCKSMAGYDHHTTNDLHLNQSGFATGILNEFMELKAGEMPRDVLKYNGESVVLIDNTQNFNLCCGEAKEYDVMSSLYGSGLLAKGRLTWTLVDTEQHVHQSGEIDLKNIPNGTVHKIGKIRFTAPDLIKPMKVTLRVRLTGGEYDIENDWDHWVFPKREAPAVTAAADDTILQKYGGRYKGFVPIKDSSSKLRILSALTPEAVEFMRSGGSVVMLGYAPFETAICSLQISWPGMHHPHATVVYDHPLTMGFPNDGYLGWQFFSMFENTPGVDFTDTALSFDPIIEVAYGYKVVRKVSSLFEMEVANGKLLVCTLNFDLNDPAAVYMLDNIVSYAAGSSFEPRTRARVQDVLSILGIKPKEDEWVNPMGEAYNPFEQDEFKKTK